MIPSQYGVLYRFKIYEKGGRRAALPGCIVRGIT